MSVGPDQEQRRLLGTQPLLKLPRRIKHNFTGERGRFCLATHHDKDVQVNGNVTLATQTTPTVLACASFGMG